MTRTIVLDPGTRFDAVAAGFADWEGGPTDLHALLDGEPIGARWTRGESEASYSANPAIGLRVLSGEGFESVADRMPVLGPSRARELARSPDLAESLLGVTAVGLYGDLAAVDDLAALARDPRPELRAAAELALRRIGVASLEVAADRIAERRRQAPDEDPLFRALGSPSTRRQLIRWLAAKPPSERARQVELVRAAMRDEDWEVRWSAVIAAFELDLGELALDVRRCARAEEADREDRQILEALRDVVGRHLVGGVSDHPGAAHLRACLAGGAEPRDRAFALIASLRRPLPVAQVPTAPPGFCTVPAIVHWVGDPDLQSHPLRAVVPESSFAIADVVREPVPREGLPAALGELSAELRLPLRLPTPLELEMAVRGPDGRRYPWGNGRERSSRRERSPWGLHDPLRSPEWVDADGAPLVLGDVRAGCAGPARPASAAALRPVIGDARSRSTESTHD